MLKPKMYEARGPKMEFSTKRKKRGNLQYIYVTMLLLPKKPHRSMTALINRQKHKQMIPKKTNARKKTSYQIEMVRYRQIHVPA